MADAPEPAELLADAINQLRQAYVDLDRLTEHVDEPHVDRALTVTETALDHAEAAEVDDA